MILKLDDDWFLHITIDVFEHDLSRNFTAFTTCCDLKLEIILWLFWNMSSNFCDDNFSLSKFNIDTRSNFDEDSMIAFESMSNLNQISISTSINALFINTSSCISFVTISKNISLNTISMNTSSWMLKSVEKFRTSICYDRRNVKNNQKIMIEKISKKKKKIHNNLFDEKNAIFDFSCDEKTIQRKNRLKKWISWIFYDDEMIK